MPDLPAEFERLEQERSRTVRWKRWGPYVAERAWGTVREDYSQNGDAWNFFPHDHARSRAYRWNEDGLAGFCNRQQTLCLGIGLWNEQDEILKERLFGLTGPEGNHAEDVKEIYYYEDATPTSSYLRYRYRYPQKKYPYRELVDIHRGRPKTEREIELADLGMFDEGRYFDVTVEYAKTNEDDVFMFVTADNRGPDDAPLHILIQAWLRNTWSWENEVSAGALTASANEKGCIGVEHEQLGAMQLYLEPECELLFTENESNHEKLFGTASRTPYVKDAFHHRIIDGATDKVNPALTGTKAAGWQKFVVPAGKRVQLVARLCADRQSAPLRDAQSILTQRRAEADAFYAHIQGQAADISEERRAIQRQASAGLLWTMQFYNFDVDRWLKGDAIAPPQGREAIRNGEWRHLSVADVISMPDKWEYPWFAAWDLAFHAVAMASIDTDLAKAQLKFMVKEWYQAPSGQTPAYEWEFSDLNPPVLAWATYQVFKIERKQRGKGDRVFLERVFHKLLMNFAWWVNRKDDEGNNLFEGGFLGLDNISVLDRSEKLPPGTLLEQADATAWMAMYCLDLMRISLELAEDNSAYEDLASKFFEHFLYIAHALNHPTKPGQLVPWNESEGFYFDIIKHDGHGHHIPVRSLVGLIPLFAVHVITAEQYNKLGNFRRRKLWFLERNPHLAEAVTERPDGRWVLSAVGPGRLERVLSHLFDEAKFLSTYGPRTLSKEHLHHPVTLTLEDGRRLFVGYEPGESTTRMKGGNSNWRGPIWFPAGYLIYRSLLRLDHGFGDVVSIPGTPHRQAMSLRQGAKDLAARMISIFEKDDTGRRPVFGESKTFQESEDFCDRLLFYEYFNGDSGEGLGASHQTGWTALIADMILREARWEKSET